MPHSVINLEVVQPGDRAQQLLAGVASRLGFCRFTAVPSGQLPVFMDLDAPEAWDVVVAKLQEAGPDWREYIALGERPER